MINYIWIFLVFFGIFISLFTGKINQLGNIILSSTSNAFNVFLKISFMIVFWNGMFNILKDTGYLKKMSKLLSRILKIFFKELDENSPAMEYISITLLSNILGLGIASTSTGLKAFEFLKEEAKGNKLPSKAMVTFIILNITSFTIFPTTIITIRNNFGSVNEIKTITMIMIVTLLGSGLGLVLDNFFNKVRRK